MHIVLFYLGQILLEKYTTELKELLVYLTVCKCVPFNSFLMFAGLTSHNDRYMNCATQELWTDIDFETQSYSWRQNKQGC
jgi:hypothetical protein